jgi:Flp pilus assembly protein TadB
MKMQISQGKSSRSSDVNRLSRALCFAPAGRRRESLPAGDVLASYDIGKTVSLIWISGNECMFRRSPLSQAAAACVFHILLLLVRLWLAAAVINIFALPAYQRESSRGENF